jgi:hypothetical protein
LSIADPDDADVVAEADDVGGRDMAGGTEEIGCWFGNVNGRRVVLLSGGGRTTNGSSFTCAVITAAEVAAVFVFAFEVVVGVSVGTGRTPLIAIGFEELVGGGGLLL